MEGKRRGRAQGQKNILLERRNNRCTKNKNDNLRHNLDYSIYEQVVAGYKSLSSSKSNETIYKSKNISSERDFEKKDLESNSQNSNLATKGLSLLQSYEVDDDIVEKKSSRANGKKIVDFLFCQSCCFYFLLDVYLQLWADQILSNCFM